MDLGARRPEKTGRVQTRQASMARKPSRKAGRFGISNPPSDEPIRVSKEIAMENLLDDSVPVLDRDVWPYAVGQLGGILIAVGAFLMLRGATVVGYDTFVAGAAVLGIAWTRL